MALHINLFHEIAKARQLKRRDPLKLSMYGLSAIAACCALFYFIELGRNHVLRRELFSAQEKFRAIEPKAKAAKKIEDDLNVEIKKGEAITQRIERRFYWAPLLEQLSQVVPREIQITRLVGDVTGDKSRKCALMIDGISTGADPRRTAEELRTAIAEKFAPKYHSVTSTFKSLDDGSELVMLDGKQLPTATFAINIVLTTGDETTPAQPRKK
jgi:antitoxin component of MazEF toxin-antitoxin module